MNLIKSIIINLLILTPIVAAELPMLELAAEDSVITGNGLKKEGAYKSKLRMWQDTTSTVNWKFTLTEPGKVDIYIHQACPKSAAGGTYKLNVEHHQLTGNVATTASWNSYRTVHVGTIEFKTSGPKNLLLQASTIPQGFLMQLDKLILKGSCLKNATRQGYVLPAIERINPIIPVVDKQLPHNTLSKFEREAGWQLLFDGESLNGWTGYRKAELPVSWAAKKGLLSYSPKDNKTGVDLITQNQYSNFEFVCEWSIAEGGDSGIFFRFDESKHHPFEQFPEYQIFDNHTLPKSLRAKQAAGACYDIFPSDIKSYKGAHQWNHTRIVANGQHIEFFLNHVKTADFTIGSGAFAKLVNSTKFCRWADFGKLRKGHIGLQAYSSEVKFRNIKIKPILDNRGK